MGNELRPLWRNLFNLDWKFGLFLLIIICIPRFILVLNANETSSYSYIGFIMTISAIVPFIFLSKSGRISIGLTKVNNYRWLLISFIGGLSFSLILYVLGTLIYQDTFYNWYVYIGYSYNIPTEIMPHDKLIMFIIMAITGMIFSPIGEELFFRGIAHSSFAKLLGNVKASIIDSSAFALTHISHFWLIFVNNEWKLLTTSTLIWVGSMFLHSILFYFCRRKTNSLLGSIVCHSAFNLGMVFSIFYLLN